MLKCQCIALWLAILFIVEQPKSSEATPLDDYVNAPDSNVKPYLNLNYTNANKKFTKS